MGPWDIGKLGEWAVGTLGGWDPETLKVFYIGRVGYWDNGTLGGCADKRLGHLDARILDIGTPAILQACVYVSLKIFM